VSTALINIAANLILIPPLSYVGAAIATIIAESLCVILVFYFIIIHTKFSVKYKNIMSILVSSFLMAIFIYIFNDLNMIILVILAMILYIFLLYLTKTFSDDDIHLIKQMKR